MKRSSLSAMLVLVCALLIMTSQAFAASPACLRIGRATNFGWSIYTHLGYYDFTFLDPLQGTTKQYAVDGQPTASKPNANGINITASPDGKYIARVIDIGTQKHPKSRFILTSSGLDRRPITQIDYDLSTDAIKLTWLSNSLHLLVSAERDDGSLIALKLLDTSGKIIEQPPLGISVSPKQRFSYIAMSQDNTQIDVLAPGRDGKNMYLEVWSLNDLSIIKTVSLPGLSYNSGKPAFAWRPRTDEYVYLSVFGNDLSLVFRSLHNDLEVTLLLPDKAVDLQTQYIYSAAVVWSPNGKYLSALINDVRDWSLSTLHIADVSGATPILVPNVAQVTAQDCAGGCYGPRVRWTKDGEAIHFLQHPLHNLPSMSSEQNSLVAYFPKTKQYSSLAFKVWFGIIHDETEEWLSVSHAWEYRDGIEWKLEYVRTDGTENWTALSAITDMLTTVELLDGKHVVGYSLDSLNTGIEWANRDLRRTFQASFDGKKVLFDSWAVNSRYFAFSVSNADETSREIWVANTNDGSYIKLLPTTDVSTEDLGFVYVGPNGQLIASQRTGKATNRFRLFKNNGEEIPLNLPIDSSIDPAIVWSLDGEYIAFPGDKSLAIMRNDGTLVRTFRDVDNDNFTVYDWTPCDQPLAGWSVRDPAEYPLWP